MFKVSFKKILRDLFQEKGKLFAVVLAISIGIFCFALLSTAQDLLKKNLSADYLATNPRDFAISVMNIDDQYLDDISSYDYIEDLEVRTKVPARIMVDDNYLALDLYVVEDFNDIVINTFGLDSGNLPIISNELLIERDGKKLIDMEIGDSLDVRIPDYSNRQVTVSGFAHDPSFAPSSNEGIIYGYISEDFLGEYGYELAYKDIYITLSGDVKTKADVEAISFALKDEMMSRDVIVRSVTNLEPNTHPNQTQMNALMFLLMMIGSLALILSGFIIITMISSIMEKQLSQIGILKTIGASTKQIIGIYMTTVLILTLISTIIALPLGIMAGYQYAGFVCAFLNFNLILTQLSIGTIILQIVFTLGVPLLMSLLPIIKSSRITVREAIYKDIKEENIVAKKVLEISSLRQIPKMAIRNIFRQPARFFMILIVLVLGGALFMSAMNIKSASDASIAYSFEDQAFDYYVDLTSHYSQDTLGDLVKSYDEVSDIMLYKKQMGVLVEGSWESGITGLTALPIETNLRTFRMTEGRWFDRSDSIDSKNIIINTPFSNAYKQVQVGDTIIYRVGGVEETYHVIGIVDETFTMPIAYVPLKEGDMVNGLYIHANEPLAQSPEKTLRQIEEKLLEEGIDSSFSFTVEFFEERIVQHLVVIFAFLMFMTVLVIFVGGLGFVTTMNINVIERTREIGILRALGMKDKYLRRMIVLEGIIIAIISWVVSIGIAIPLSRYLGSRFFDIFFEAKIQHSISLFGMFLWLDVVVFFSVIASLISVRNAMKLSVRESLSYE